MNLDLRGLEGEDSSGPVLRITWSSDSTAFHRKVCMDTRHQISKERPPVSKTISLLQVHSRTWKRWLLLHSQVKSSKIDWSTSISSFRCSRYWAARVERLQFSLCCYCSSFQVLMDCVVAYLTWEGDQVDEVEARIIELDSEGTASALIQKESLNRSEHSNSSINHQLGRQKTNTTTSIQPVWKQPLAMKMYI